MHSVGLNIFISYYNYTSIQIYMKIIQAMGLERKLKAYKVLLPALSFDNHLSDYCLRAFTQLFNDFFFKCSYTV